MRRSSRRANVNFFLLIVVVVFFFTSSTDFELNLVASKLLIEILYHTTLRTCQERFLGSNLKWNWERSAPVPHNKAIL